MSPKENKSFVTFNNASLNKTMIKKIVEKNIDPSNKINILEYQIFIKKILQNYNISESPDTIFKNFPDLNEWKLQLSQSFDTQSIPITQHGVTTIQHLLQSINMIEQINKKVLAIQKSFHKKLSEEIKSENTTIWNTMMDWITKSLSIHINSNIPNKPLLKKTNDWIINTKTTMEKNLNSSLKDYIHSLVNQNIILAKILNANGWKQQIAKQEIKENKLIQKIEKEIHKELNNITKNINAPFIKAFSKELFTRCYKHLLSPIKKASPNQTINELTKDLNSKPKQIKWPNDIQTKFDNEYLTFLTTITTNPPNIKKYAKDNFKSLKAISNHKKLSLNEKKDIQQTYFKIYKLTRRYERLLNTLKHTSTSASIDTLTKTICMNIEITYHEFKPFLSALIQHLYTPLQTSDSTTRKKMIKIYDAGLKHLQEATKTLELARLVNQHLEKYPNINNLNENKTIQQHITPITLEKTMEPWKNHTWNPLLNAIIELIGIKKPPPKKRLIEPINDISHPTVEMMVKSPPENSLTKQPRVTLDNHA